MELLAFFLEYIQCSNLISTSCLNWCIHSHCWLLHLNYVICYFFLRNSHYYNNLIVFLKLLELARSNWCQIDVTWGQLWDHKRSKLILTWNTMLTNEIIVHVKSVEMEFYHEIFMRIFFWCNLVVGNYTHLEWSVSKTFHQERFSQKWLNASQPL